ncbi:MAG: hypothetical protein ACJAVN_001677 [Roseivirga sp.]|jgi:hypothetical protein
MAKTFIGQLLYSLRKQLPLSVSLEEDTDGFEVRILSVELDSQSPFQETLRVDGE